MRFFGGWGLNCLRGAWMGIPLLVPSRPSVRNNAFVSVTLCIVASVALFCVCVAPRKRQVKIEYSCLGALSQNRPATCPRLSPRSTVILWLRTRWLHCIHVCVFGQRRVAATIPVQGERESCAPHNFCGPYRFPSVE